MDPPEKERTNNIIKQQTHLLSLLMRTTGKCNVSDAPSIGCPSEPNIHKGPDDEHLSTL